MEERKWEDLNSDCLVNIFKRLDPEMLLSDVPLVCKHWYQALLNPLCWQKLVFPSDYAKSRLTTALYDKHNVLRVTKFAVSRSQGQATIFVPPIFATIEDVKFVLDTCPALKYLAVPSYALTGDEEDMIGAVLLGYPFVDWNYIDMIDYRHCNYMLEIIDKICLQYKNFVGLSVEQVHINDFVASAIASKLGNIKCLVLDKAIIDEEDLETILQGCKELEVFYVRHCVGFDEDNENILNLASGIKDFRCEGSRVSYDEEYEDYVDYEDDEESEDYVDYEEKEVKKFPPFPDYILYGDY